MKLVQLDRQQGKTTKLLEWMAGAPEGVTRVYVAPDSATAMRVYFESQHEASPFRGCFKSDQFFGYREWMNIRASRYHWPVEVGVDNLDIILSYIFHQPPTIATTTERFIK